MLKGSVHPNSKKTYLIAIQIINVDLMRSPKSVEFIVWGPWLFHELLLRYFSLNWDIKFSQMNSRHCPEFAFHTCNTQQEIVSEVFSPTGKTLYGLGEGFHWGRACKRKDMTRIIPPSRSWFIWNIVNMPTRSLWILQKITCFIHTLNVWFNWFGHLLSYIQLLRVMSR